MSKNFADKAIDFCRHLHYQGELPKGFQVINPYLENPETLKVMQEFYHKYYNDSHSRRFIIGINPGKHGAGTTGIPFTDTKRLESACGIKMLSIHTYAISSVFIYDVIAAYGGAERFYKKFYINSSFPLAILQQIKEGKWVNANYYDEPILFESVKSCMITTLNKIVTLGMETSEVFILGKKNADFMMRLNKEIKLFSKLTVLEHPRFIQQYKSRDRQLYIDKYLKAFEK